MKEENLVKNLEKTEVLDENKVYITREEIAVIAEKTGYSEATVQGVLRGYIPRIQRHQPIFDLYEKVKYFRKLHNENFMKDIKNL